MRQTVSISLPAGIKKKLDSLAKKERMNRSDLIREALMRFFSAREFREIRKRMVPQARRRGVYTDEDVFRIVS